MYSLRIIPKPKLTALSDLELCSNITEWTDTKDLFYKNTYRAIPNPGLVFGSTTHPVVFSYVELYNLLQGKPYVLTIRVVDLKDVVLKQHQRTRQFVVSNTVDVATLNVSSLASGKYKFQMVLFDTSGNEIARTEKTIFLYNPNVQNRTMTPSSVRIGEFASLTADELTEEFRQAQYIARAEDKTAFNKLHAPEEQRAFLARFWTEIESGNHGLTNFTRALYLQRVLVANQRYKSLGKEGWYTDRGRVYILYGEQDEVERFPYSSESKPYEIWHYNQIEGGVQFVFIDRSGFGEYTLVHSTKRGEIQDDNWQQYLQ